MQSRDDKEIQKFAKKLELQTIIEYLEKNGKPLPEDGARKEAIGKLFNESNKSAQVHDVVGGNNTVLILNNSDCVVVISGTGSAVSDTVKKVTENAGGMPPAWLAKEFRHESISPSSTTTISISEHFPNSLERVLKQQEMNPDNRIALACDVGQQVCSMLQDLQKSGCLWSDLKPGNIMLRNDNSIAVSDKKALVTYEKVIVNKLPLAYEKQIIKKDADLQLNGSQLKDNHMLVQAPQTATDPIQYQVRNQKGELINGSISNEELKAKYNNIQDYEAFREKLNNKPVILLEDMKKIIGVVSDKHGTLREGYRANFDETSTKAFVSTSYKQEDDKLHNTDEEARNAAIARWEKEYSYQLAEVLYMVMTGHDNDFSPDKPANFNLEQPIFDTDDGKKMKSLIEKLKVDNPQERLSLHEAYAELSKIRPPVERVQQPSEELLSKEKSVSSLRSSLKRSLSKKFIPKTIMPEAKDTKIENITDSKKLSVSIQEPEILQKKDSGVALPKKSLRDSYERPISKSIIQKNITPETTSKKEEINVTFQKREKMQDTPDAKKPLRESYKQPSSKISLSEHTRNNEKPE